MGQQTESGKVTHVFGSSKALDHKCGKINNITPFFGEKAPSHELVNPDAASLQVGDSVTFTTQRVGRNGSTAFCAKDVAKAEVRKGNGHETLGAPPQALSREPEPGAKLTGVISTKYDDHKKGTYFGAIKADNGLLFFFDKRDKAATKLEAATPVSFRFAGMEIGPDGFEQRRAGTIRKREVSRVEDIEHGSGTRHHGR